MKQIFIILLSISSVYSAELLLIDEITKDPIKYAEIFSDNRLITKSNENGLAIFDIESELEITIKATGYEFKKLIIDKSTKKDIILQRRTYQMPEVVSTGSFVPKSLQESVFDVDIISNEVIEAQKAPTLKEVLQNQANIRINNDPALGSGVSINGLGGQNVKILIDGVPMIGRENGNINVSHIVMSEVEQIEIIEGPMSAIYGTDALAGVINIITKSNPKEDLNIGFDSYYENAGTANGLLRGNYRYGKNSFIFSGGRNFFSGWSPEGTNPVRSHQWDPKEQYFGNLRYDRSFKNSTFSYTLNLMDEFILNRNEPIDPPYNETGIDNEFTTLRVGQSLFYKSDLGNKKYLDLTGSYQFYRRERENFVKNLVTLDRNFISAQSANQVNDNSNYLFRAVYSDDDFVSFLNYQLGIETNYEDISGVRILNQRQAIGDYAGFASLSFKPADYLTIQPMVRAIYNTRYDAPLVPSINMKLDLPYDFNIRAGFARAFRAPNVKELYLEFIDQNHFVIGNPSLESEQSYSYNLALNYSLTSSGNIFRTEAKYFYNELENLITLAINGFNTQSQQQIYSYANVDEFRTQGGEVNFSYLRDEFTLNLAGTYIGRWSSLSRDFLYTPELTSNLIYYFRDLGLNLALLYKYTGTLRSFGLANGSQINDDGVVDPEDLEEFQIEAFSNLDLTITKSFWDSRLEFSGGVKNIFDVTNLNTVGQQQGGAHSGGNVVPFSWGRTFFFGLKVNMQ